MAASGGSPSLVQVVPQPNATAPAAAVAAASNTATGGFAKSATVAGVKINVDNAAQFIAFFCRYLFLIALPAPLTIVMSLIRPSDLPAPWNTFPAITHALSIHAFGIPWFAALVGLISWVQSGFRYVSYFEAIVFPCAFAFPLVSGFAISLRLVTDRQNARVHAFAILQDAFKCDTDYMDRKVDGEREHAHRMAAAAKAAAATAAAVVPTSGTVAVAPSSPLEIKVDASAVTTLQPPASVSMPVPAPTSTPVVTISDIGTLHVKASNHHHHSSHEPERRSPSPSGFGPLHASSGTKEHVWRPTKRGPLRRLLEHWHDRSDTTLCSMIDSQLKKAGLTRSHPYSHATGGSKLLAWGGERYLCFVMASVGSIVSPFIARPVIYGTDSIWISSDDAASGALSDRERRASIVLVLASVVACYWMLFTLFDSFIRVPLYWLRELDGNRKLLNESCVFPLPTLTCINHDEFLAPVTPKWCNTCHVSLQFDPLHSVSNLRTWWKIRSFHILIGTSLMSWMSAMVGLSILVFIGSAVWCFYVVVSKSPVTDTVIFIAYVAVFTFVYALFPFLKTMTINESYEKETLIQLTAGLVTTTQHMANLSAARAKQERVRRSSGAGDGLRQRKPLMGSLLAESSDTLSSLPGSSSADIVHDRLLLMHKHLVDYRLLVRQHGWRLNFLGIPVNQRSLLTMIAGVATLVLSTLSRIFVSAT